MSTTTGAALSYAFCAPSDTTGAALSYAFCAPADTTGAALSYAFCASEDAAVAPRWAVAAPSETMGAAAAAAAVPTLVAPSDVAAAASEATAWVMSIPCSALLGNILLLLILTIFLFFILGKNVTYLIFSQLSIERICILNYQSLFSYVYLLSYR